MCRVIGHGLDKCPQLVRVEVFVKLLRCLRQVPLTQEIIPTWNLNSHMSAHQPGTQAELTSHALLAQELSGKEMTLAAPSVTRYQDEIASSKITTANQQVKKTSQGTA